MAQLVCPKCGVQLVPGDEIVALDRIVDGDDYTGKVAHFDCAKAKAKLQ